jgi:hypothetical protein
MQSFRRHARNAAMLRAFVAQHYKLAAMRGVVGKPAAGSAFAFHLKLCAIQTFSVSIR